MLAFLLAVLNLPQLDPETATTPSAHIGQRLTGDSDAVEAALASPASIGSVTIAPVCSFGAAPLTSNPLGDVAALSRPFGSPQCAGGPYGDFGAGWFSRVSRFVPFGAFLPQSLPPRAFEARPPSVPVFHVPFGSASTPALRTPIGAPGRPQLRTLPPPGATHVMHVEPHAAFVRR